MTKSKLIYYQALINRFQQNLFLKPIKIKKMKKIFKFFFSLILFAAMSVLISCGNDDDGISVGTGNDDCTASWKVNGENFSENDMSLCVFLDNTLNLSSSITGGDFQLQIDPISTTGTYVADPFNQDLNVIVMVRLADGTQLGSSNAIVNVTELSDSKARGTFSGDFFDIQDLTFSPDFSITDGVFEANF